MHEDRRSKFRYWLPIALQLASWSAAVVLVIFNGGRWSARQDVAADQLRKDQGRFVEQYKTEFAKAMSGVNERLSKFDGQIGTLVGLAQTTHDETIRLSGETSHLKEQLEREHQDRERELSDERQQRMAEAGEHKAWIDNLNNKVATLIGQAAAQQPQRK